MVTSRYSLSLSLGLCLVFAAGCHGQTVNVSIDPAVHYQTILGWGKTTPWLPCSPLLRQEVIDRAVNDFGINRLRFEGLCGNTMRGRSWEWLNDDDDPFHINWAGFNTAALDSRAREWLQPWKKAVEARGEPFDLYVSPSFFHSGSSGDVPPWMLADPNEYAEWATALLLRLRDTDGIVANYYCICNEAGNNNAFTPRVVAACIRALMPRLRQLGFPTTIEFPESVNPHVAMRYIKALQGQTDLWHWIGLISYHLYGADNQSALVQLHDFAQARHLPTAQTEFMGLTIDNLYDDMVLGGVSYWEVYGLMGPNYRAALQGVSSATFSGGPWYWRFRQVSHYVRPGAVRIGGRSSDPALRLLAFSHHGGVTVVLINTRAPQRARTVTITGLPAGLYGRCQAVDRQPYEELGREEVRAGERVTVSVPANTVLTLYPRGVGNQPPTVTAWQAEPMSLTVPAASARLLCSATDPDLDPLHCSWSVASCPTGATPSLNPMAGWSVRAERLSVPGDYVFTAAVSDGEHTVRRQVLLKVFAGNQPPVPIDVHNRQPVWVRVKDGGTVLRAGAWDVENDPLTFHWRVKSQPAGAAAVLATPDKPRCRVTGMTVAGNYVFELQVSDPQHTVTVEHTVPVY